MTTTDITELMAVLADNDSARRASGAIERSMVPARTGNYSGRHAAKGVQFLGIETSGRHEGLAVFSGVNL